MEWVKLMVFHCLNMMSMLMINHGNFQVRNIDITFASFYMPPCHITGADITDYFNYGFTEETWKLYCERQRQMKSEVGQLNKTVSSSASACLLVGPRTYSYSNRQLVPYCYKNNSALITVLMLNLIFLLIIIIATLVRN